MISLFLLVGMLILVGSIIVTPDFFSMKLLATSLKKAAVAADNNNNSLIQFTGKVNVSSLHENSTQMTNVSSNSQEIHKPLSPKSAQEIQREKEQIQKSKPNTTVFKQQLPGTS